MATNKLGKAMIGIVDDRVSYRTTLKKRIEIELKKQKGSWAVIDIDPFVNMGEYISWIMESEIAVLILDEKLHEGASGKPNVDYNGSDLIMFLRERLKDFPVYIITSYDNDEDLQKKFSCFEEIWNRDNFYSKPGVYMPRLIRAGQRFLRAHRDQLSRLSELSKKIAAGQATSDEKKELEAIQANLQIPFTPIISDRESWLSQYEGKLKELDELCNVIQAHLDANK